MWGGGKIHTLLFLFFSAFEKRKFLAAVCRRGKKKSRGSELVASYSGKNSSLSKKLSLGKRAFVGLLEAKTKRNLVRFLLFWKIFVWGARGKVRNPPPILSSFHPLNREDKEGFFLWWWFWIKDLQENRRNCDSPPIFFPSSFFLENRLGPLLISRRGKITLLEIDFCCSSRLLLFASCEKERKEEKKAKEKIPSPGLENQTPSRGFRFHGKSEDFQGGSLKKKKKAAENTLVSSVVKQNKTQKGELFPFLPSGGGKKKAEGGGGEKSPGGSRRSRGGPTPKWKFPPLPPPRRLLRGCPTVQFFFRASGREARGSREKDGGEARPCLGSPAFNAAAAALFLLFACGRVFSCQSRVTGEKRGAKGSSGLDSWITSHPPSSSSSPLLFSLAG